MTLVFSANAMRPEASATMSPPSPPMEAICRTSVAVIGRTTLFPHSLNVDYAMPKFSAVVPTAATSGEWEEMAFPAGTGVGAVQRVQTAREIVDEMMAQALRRAVADVYRL